MDWITFVFEMIFDGICDIWFYLMQRIVPDKMENPKFQKLLKVLVGIFSIALLFCVLIGIVYLLSKI